MYADILLKQPTMLSRVFYPKWIEIILSFVEVSVPQVCFECKYVYNVNQHMND